jgi:hypothetical protein
MAAENRLPQLSGDYVGDFLDLDQYPRATDSLAQTVYSPSHTRKQAKKEGLQKAPIGFIHWPLDTSAKNS